MLVEWLETETAFHVNSSLINAEVARGMRCVKHVYCTVDHQLALQMRPFSGASTVIHGRARYNSSPVVVDNRYLADCRTGSAFCRTA